MRQTQSMPVALLSEVSGDAKRKAPPENDLC
jgi:hypothetical protein